MERPITKNPVFVFYGIILFGFILFSASCNGSAKPTLDQYQSEQPSSPSSGKATDLPAPVPHLAAGQHLRFETISLEEGLSQSTVFCMLQDRQGFMWFGTEDGLNRYDGYNFTVYKHDPEDPHSISSNWIQVLLEDEAGMLWIGTSDRGLNRYDEKLDQFANYRHDLDVPSSLSDDEVTAVFQDRDGVIWIGTGSGGLDRYDKEIDGFIHYQYSPHDPNSLSSNAVTAIYQDQEGILWIGTFGGGLNRFEPDQERWQRYVNDPSDPLSLSDNRITAIHQDQSGALWVGSLGSGLDRFDKENQRFIHYQYDPNDPGSVSSNEITTLYRDRGGVLWIGTRAGGINWFDTETESFVHYLNVPGDPHSLSSNLVLSIFQDREGMIWFGTVSGGVSKLNLGWMNFALFQNNPNDPNSLADNMIRAFYQDSQVSLWIGTSFGGLDRFDRQDNSWHHYLHDPADPGSLSSDWVSSIYRDRSGVLWVGTSNGLDRFNPETGSATLDGDFTHYQPVPDAPQGTSSNFILMIYETQNGEFWISTTSELYRFDRQEGSWSSVYRYDPGDPDSLSNGWVYVLQEDNLGRLWIGTFGGGLNRFDPEEEVFIHYQNDPKDSNSLSNNFVSGILQDRSGEMWIGTNGGLNRFDPTTEIFTHYHEKDGLPNETIYCMAEDAQGYLWLSTNKGLSRFDTQSETFRNYEVNDGLQSNEFNGKACLKNYSGEMFFGGIDGFNAFFPENIRDNPTPPPVVLKSFMYGDEQAELGKAGDSLSKVTLKWPENSFEFEYAALSYAQPEKNQYAYYLEGFEETWNEVGTRRNGQYTNLPGGTYTLRVKGSNNDGVWNETGTMVKITVVPAYWETWLFRGAMLLLLVGSAIGGFRLRIRNLKSRSLELESQVELRTTELMKIEQDLKKSEMEKAIAEERNRLARDLHDSVTQSIYSLTLLAEAGQRMIKSGDLQQVESNNSRLREIAQQALQEMRLLVYELRPQVLHGGGLVDALEKRLEAVERRAGIDARLVVDGELEISEEQEMELLHISQEALNNALKHSRASEVVLSLCVDEDNLRLEVKDNGQGFDQQIARGKGGMGLTNMAERVEKMGGKLTIQSRPDRGTIIRVIVPINSPKDSQIDLQTSADHQEVTL